jgi:hypothetical protein
MMGYETDVGLRGVGKKPEKNGKTGKKTRKNGKKRKKTGKKRGKSGKRREKESKNIKACRIENTLNLVMPCNDFHLFF